MESLPFEIIYRWDSEEARQKMIFDGDQLEAERYLEAVDEIQRSDNDSAILIAMMRLEAEFRNILISHSNPISPFPHQINTKEEELEQEEQRQPFCACFGHICFGASSSASAKRRIDDDKLLRFDRGGSSSSSSSFAEMDVMPCDAISNLRCIAERMISSGYLCPCIHVYGSVRKSCIIASYQRLGIGDVLLPLEANIERWKKATTFCVRTLFAGEKKLCEQIFDGVDAAIAHACFMETVKEPAIQLLKFADATCEGLRSSHDKLLKILELYETLAHLMPDIEVVFDSESIRVLAAEVLSRLAQAAKGALSEFENAVFRDTSKVPVPGGATHPLTRYVMHDLSLISNYKRSLNELTVPKLSLDMDFDEEEGKTPSANHLIRIIVVLQMNLDGKSKQYKDESLSHLFMMNNLHYIFKVARRCAELRDIIGNDYLKSLVRKFQQAAISYHRTIWSRVLYCLCAENEFRTGVRRKRVLKENIKTFNTAFKKIHRTQSAWLIPDSQLREDLQISILEKLIPAHNTFVGRNSSLLPLYYLKYTQLDLENAVSDLFGGIPVSDLFGGIPVTEHFVSDPPILRIFRVYLPSMYYLKSKGFVQPWITITKIGWVKGLLIRYIYIYIYIIC